MLDSLLLRLYVCKRHLRSSECFLPIGFMGFYIFYILSLLPKDHENSLIRRFHDLFVMFRPFYYTISHFYEL